MTAAVWVRGWFREEWGVSTDEIEWVTYRPERIDIPVPATRGQADNLFEGLVNGEVDAIMSARRPPEEYFPSTGEPGKIKRLFPDVWNDEREFYNRTGVFPIMHLVTVRNDVCSEFPNLPLQIYQTFSQVKDAAVANLIETIKLGVTLPFVLQSVEEAQRLMNGDIWPYGVSKNEAQLKRFIQYLVDDGLIKQPVPLEQVFHPSVMNT
jgi:4,5-dihydroxyphthalate decarboxylase